MSTCDTGNDYNGDVGARVSSVFVVLVTSFLGAWFPVYSRRHKGVFEMPDWSFFAAKYFGSGVIIATAFIHLLAPACDALTDPCLTGPITEYDWAEGIALMTIFVMFFLELMTMRYANFEEPHKHDSTSAQGDNEAQVQRPESVIQAGKSENPSIMAQDHYAHKDEHTDNEALPTNWEENSLFPENYTTMLTGVFILEFGIIFHSIFVGLTLAVAGNEFKTLYIVVVFHQTFEGLGLGSRLALVPWPKSKRWTPYILATAYGLTTPVAIAIGLGVRNSYPPNSQTTLIVNGVFDSISAGILIYTGLVELMAHEFMFSPQMSKTGASLKKLMSAFLLMCFGAGLMALLGKWA